MELSSSFWQKPFSAVQLPRNWLPISALENDVDIKTLEIWIHFQL